MRALMAAAAAAGLLLIGAGSGAAQEHGQDHGSSVPSFCRSGDGHPVHGRSWCVQRGFPLGSTVTWRQERWEDVALRILRRDGVAPRSVLEEIVGAEALGRLEEQRRRLNLSGALSGRWLAAETGGMVLEVHAGRTPIAELVDLDGNGRVDLVLLNAGLRQGEPRNAEQ